MGRCRALPSFLQCDGCSGETAAHARGAPLLQSCFKAAARVSQGPGSPEQLDAWAGMAAIPSELVQKILILADLEIWETMAPPAHIALVRQG